MRNIEKYKDELILNAIANSIAIHKESKKIVPCTDLACVNCHFYGPSANCIEGRLEWLQEEYKEPEVDWSEVEVDTPIYVKQYEDTDWERRYFARYENGKVYAWANGTTSYTADNEEYCAWWEYAELAENFITTNERVLDE